MDEQESAAAKNRQQIAKDKRRRYNHVQHGINSNAHWSDPKLALDHSCAMNFDRQYQKQEKKAERAQFEPNYQSMSSRAENDDTLQTRKNNPTADYRTPLELIMATTTKVVQALLAKQTVQQRIGERKTTFGPKQMK